MRTFYLLLLWVGCGLASNYSSYYCEPGRDVMVLLFEWTWPDVANECETYLSDNDICGVQISNPAEHALIRDPPYPWWQRYQPVSYELTSRGGDEAAFVDMVTRCNNAGVRIYVDAVINHMTGSGSGDGSAGNTWDGTNYDYPAVPYNQSHFNLHFGPDATCPTSDGNIWDYNDAVQCRNCMLSGLRDLRLERADQRANVINFMNKMLNHGVAGFRLDTAKHLWPSDLDYIWSQLNHLPAPWFPALTRPYFYLEIIHLGNDQGWIPDYVPSLGRHNEFRYGTNLGDCINKRNGQMMAYLKDFGEGWAFTSPMDAVAFLSNHDNQRGHGGGGDSVLTFRDPKAYKMGHVFMLGWEYGHIRLMSSYNWPLNMSDGNDLNDWMGPPSDGNGNTNTVDCSDPNLWICEHRWSQIKNMIRFHNVAMGKGVQKWWDNGANLISFGRGDSATSMTGFIVINNEEVTHDRSYDTAMPEGTYCDVITCDTNRPPCVATGSSTCRLITVNSDGWAQIKIDPYSSEEDPYVAIHV